MKQYAGLETKHGVIRYLSNKLSADFMRRL